jgi:MFS family permease
VSPSLGGEAPARAAAGVTAPGTLGSAAGGSLLGQRDFSALWWGQLISIFGDRLTYLALVGLLAKHTGEFRDAGAAWLLSVLANVMLAPVLLFSPFTGAWVDRWNLKRVLVVSDLLRAALVALIPVLYALQHGTTAIFALVFALFTCNVFFLPARSAITPEIVPASQLLAANALLTGAGIAATAVGALAGGWTVDHWGWAAALRIDAATYLVSVLSLLWLRYHPERHHASLEPITLRGYLRQVGEGAALLTRNPAVGLALIALGAAWVGGGFLHVAGNLHIQRAASIPGMERVGVLLCALGLGSALGTWWVNAKGRERAHPVLLGIGLIVVGLGLTAFAASTRFVVFAGAAFLIGIAAAPAFVLSETLLQQGTEPAQRGRIFSLRDFLMRLLFLLAVTIASPVTRAFGTRAALLLCAALMALAGALALLWGRRHPELMRLGPAGEAAPPPR